MEYTPYYILETAVNPDSDTFAQEFHLVQFELKFNTLC